jgi:hypothetical protein
MQDEMLEVAGAEPRGCAIEAGVGMRPAHVGGGWIRLVRPMVRSGKGMGQIREAHGSCW